MADHELIRRLEHARLAAGRPRGCWLLAGASRPGSAMAGEVARRREYAPGDDFRQIDWPWCARHDELLTRVSRAPDDCHAYLLLDCSPSMGLGQPPKRHLAQQIAALLAYVALARLDRVSLIAFADGIVDETPPVRHKGRFPRLLRFLDRLSLQATRTNLARTAEAFVRRYQAHGAVVVLSDLYDPDGFQRGLDILRARGYAPRVVQVFDPREAEAGLLGDVELWDVEARTVRRLTITERAAERYRRALAEFHESVRRYCARRAIPCLQIASDTPQTAAFERILLGPTSARTL